MSDDEIKQILQEKLKVHVHHYRDYSGISTVEVDVYFGDELITSDKDSAAE